MKRMIPSFFPLVVALTAFFALGTACSGTSTGDGDGDGDMDMAHLHMMFTALPELGSGSVYEVFVLHDDGTNSLGRFQANAEQQVFGFDGDAQVIEHGIGAMITIEDKDGDDPEPSDMVLLAVDFDDDGELHAHVMDARALGANFTESNAGFILDTPSTAETDDAMQGVWFQSPSGSRALDLPELPAAFIYEGWVIAGDTEYSTGRFRDGEGADDDLAGPDAGGDSGHPRPGQDFVTSELDLTAARTIVGISIEPMLDTGPERFSNLVFSGDPTTWTPNNLVGMVVQMDNLPSGHFLKAEAGSHEELHDEDGNEEHEE